MNESFVFYASYHEAIQCLPEEIQLEAYKSICEYAITGKEPEGCNPIVRAIFKMAKPTVESNFARRENGKLGAPYGKLGGRPRKTPVGNNEKTPKKPPTVFLKTPNENENVNENVNVNENKKENNLKEKFKKPSVEEVKAYCLERNNKVDPESFVDFYTSKGWKVGKNPMKDWKAAVRLWEKGEQRKPVESVYGASGIAPDAGRHHSKEELEKFLGRKLSIEV